MAKGGDRSRLLGIVLAVVLAVVTVVAVLKVVRSDETLRGAPTTSGPGGGTASQSAPDPAATRGVAPSGGVDQAALQRALLIASDLPAAGFTGVDDTGPAPADRSGCAALDSLTALATELPAAVRSFSSNATPVTYAETLVSGPVDRLSAAVRAVRGATSSCRVFTSSGASPTTFVTKALDVANVGDERAAVVAVTQQATTALRIAFVVARVGSVLVVIMRSTTVGPATESINTVLSRAVQRAPRA